MTSTWVVGGGGLLGSSVVSSLQRRHADVRRVLVPWHDPDAASRALVDAATTVAASDEPWRVLWCAGAGVTNSDPEQLDEELRMLEMFLDHLEAPTSPGAFLLASSAGGVHAGSTHAPFDEHSPPVAISPYGEAKLRAEESTRRFAERSGVPVLIARIANLYGPGQDTSKPQGLISQLCLAHLVRAPLSIYVPLDTARDYVFVEDAAAIVIAAVERVAEQPVGTIVVKIVASNQSVTLAALLGELRRITRRRPAVTLGRSPSAVFQTLDLRFRSRVWTDLDHLAATPLAVGVAKTMQGLREVLGRHGGAPVRR